MREKEKKKGGRDTIRCFVYMELAAENPIVGEDLFATKNHIIGHRGEVCLPIFGISTVKGGRHEAKEGEKEPSSHV